MEEDIKKIFVEALQEDLPFGDITTDNIEKDSKVGAVIVCNGEGIFCGESILKIVPRILKKIALKRLMVKDGDKINCNQKIAILNGSAKCILKTERTLLNFLSMLSGVATTTHLFAQKLKKSGIILKDTRKTLPALRILQKYAVRVGGAQNHRMNLSEFPIVKDNHIKIMMKQGQRFFIEQLKKLQTLYNGNFEIEIQDLKILDLIKKYNIYVKYLMFDNLSLCELEEGIKRVRKYEQQKGKKMFIELSGGITLDNIDEYTHFDIDYISVGSITKNITAIDFSLDIV